MKPTYCKKHDKYYDLEADEVCLGCEEEREEPATPPPSLIPDPTPEPELGKVSSLGIDMSQPADEFVGQSTEAHYRKKLFDPIREQIEILRDASQHLRETLKGGDFVQNFACGEVHAYKKILTYLDPPQVPATPDPDPKQG